jgi:hypothetical protein
MGMALKDYVEAVLATLGDVNPIEHSGGFVVKRKEGAVEMEWIEPPDDDDDWECQECGGTGDSCVVCGGTGQNPALRWTVTVAVVEPYEWVKWADVATSCGKDLAEYEAAFQSGDPKEMAFAILDAANIIGWYQFDQEPLTLTRAEVTARYKGLL